MHDDWDWQVFSRGTPISFVISLAEKFNSNTGSVEVRLGRYRSIPRAAR